MSGLKLLTKLEPKMCLKLAWRTAQDLGFSLTPIDDTSTTFTATKGNVFLSMLAGPFVPHSQFAISVAAYSDVNEIILEKNKPWLTSGTIGVRRVNRMAEEAMDAIAKAIEMEGATVLERKEF